MSIAWLNVFGTIFAIYDEKLFLSYLLEISMVKKIWII